MILSSFKAIQWLAFITFSSNQGSVIIYLINNCVKITNGENMKLLTAFLGLVIFTSCSTSQMGMSLSQKIEAEEVRSLKEVQSHIEFLLKIHPELNVELKKKLSAMLDAAMEKHQNLKNEESKIFQLLIKKSLRTNQLSDADFKDKTRLNLRLGEIYQEKYKNILGLITNFTKLSDQEVINESMNDDMMYMLRDLR